MKYQGTVCYQEMFCHSRTLSTAFVTYNLWSELRKSEKKFIPIFNKKIKGARYTRVRVILE